MTVRVKLNGQGAKGRAKRGVYAGLQAAGEHLLAVANDRVPEEEGTLMRSGTVVVDRDDTTAVVAYDTPYAKRQHEELTWRHKPGRIAKWLEVSLTEQADTLREIIAARVRRSIGGNQP